VEDADPEKDSRPLVAFDEFTSVVDRNVARVASAALAKAIRGGAIGCRFVAITCHYDVIEWLVPDWVLDMADGTCSWRRLRRPAIEIEIHRCGREAWGMFARHHYLTAAINPAARCYLATWNERPVAFCATLPLIGRRGRRRISRIVTLPDYQGIGIGTRVMDAVAEIGRDEGCRTSVTASHPALVEHCRRSPRWRCTSIKKTGSRAVGKRIGRYRTSRGRAVVSFEFVGPVRCTGPSDGTDVDGAARSRAARRDLPAIQSFPGLTAGAKHGG
jgi:GNAT superfamily N-acetyltransferase